MADIHVLSGTAAGEDKTVTTQVAFHFAIPAPDQVANVSFDMANFESVVPNISPAELTAIQAGEVVEEVHTLTWHPSETAPELATRIRANFTARKPDAITEYKARYRSFLATLAE